MKIFTTLLLLIMTTAGAAFAQHGTWTQLSRPDGIVGAPSNFTTFGIWSGQWHNIMSPAWHSGVSFENWIGSASFHHADRFALTYATRIDDMYLAAYVGGTGFGGFLNRSFSTMHSDLWMFGGELREFRQEAFPNLTAANNNRVAVLLGVADMGFRLSYGTTVGSFNVNDAYVTGLPTGLSSAMSASAGYFSELSSSYGMRQIELMWAMSSDMLDIGVRPTAALRLNFARNVATFSAFYPMSGRPTGDITAFSYNYVQPEIEVQSGWVNLFTTESGWLLRGDFTYILGFRVFSNNFSIFDPLGRSITNQSISGTAGYGGADLVERSWVNHQITPRVQLSWVGDNVSLSTRLVLDNTLTSSQANPRILNANDRVVNHGQRDVSTFTYSFQPVLDMGVRWFAIPDRFTLQAGGRFGLGDIERTVTGTTVFDADGDALPRQPTTATNVTFAAAVRELRVGATFRFNQYLALDATTGVSGTSGTINIFGSGNNNLFTFGNIMAVLTF